MRTPRNLHRTAMEFCDEANRARRRGEPGQRLYLALALHHESAAAELLPPKIDCEPTRSVLYLGAAWIAIELGRKNVAMKMARSGLEGRGDRVCRGELREVLEKAEAKL